MAVFPEGVSVQADGGVCRITLKRAGNDKPVSEIRRKGSSLPLFSEKSGREEVVFRGIGPGDYRIISGNSIINISIRKA